MGGGMLRWTSARLSIAVSPPQSPAPPKRLFLLDSCALMQVTFHCKACCPAYDGVQMSGFRYFETEAGAPLSAQMGSGQLPPGGWGE